MKLSRIFRTFLFIVFSTWQTTIGTVSVLMVALLFTMAVHVVPDGAYRDRDCVAPPVDPRKAVVHVDHQLGDEWDCRGEQFVLEAGQEFTLNFLEFSEDGTPAGATLADGTSAQLATFQRLLEPDEKTYVLVFAHGWRNNASYGNHDIHKFRILLAYAAAFVNQRCHADGDTTYCGMKVRGLALGYRGASFNERDEHGNALPDLQASLMAAPTFMARKALTDGDLARGAAGTLPMAVAAALRDIESGLALRDHTGLGPDRMIVVGHSLGANLLLRAFKADIVQAVSRHQTGSILPAVIGDLLVLVNPATTAAVWMEIAQSVRTATGVPETGRFTSTSASFFGDGQPPVVMALTATCPFYASIFEGWREYWETYFRQFHAALAEKLNPACDWVTAFALPLAEAMGSDNNGSQYSTIALGQLVPHEPDGLAGLTHGLETNTSTGTRTSFARSGQEEFNRCTEVPGWLLAARGRVAGQHEPWDAGHRRDGPKANLSPVRLASGEWKRLEIQFSLVADIYWGEPHSIDARWIASPNDPFWNVAAHANTIEHHGGYVSYQLWCALNQFVLDDTTDRYASH